MPPATNTDLSIPVPVNNVAVAAMPKAMPPSQSPGSAAASSPTLPPASIAALIVCILLVGTMTGYVIYRHLSAQARRRARKTKQKSRAHFETGEAKNALARTSVKREGIKGAVINALHTMCMLVASAPSKVFSPPVMLQFQAPNSRKTVILYGAGPHPSPPSDARVVSHEHAITNSEKGDGKESNDVLKAPNPPAPIIPRDLFSPLKSSSPSLPIPIPVSPISLPVYTSPMPMRSTARFDKHAQPIPTLRSSTQYITPNGDLVHSVVTTLPTTGVFTPRTSSPIKFIEVREILRSLSMRIPSGSVDKTPTKEGRGKENRKEGNVGKCRNGDDIV